jgi:DNA-binding NtrC family response regulator
VPKPDVLALKGAGYTLASAHCAGDAWKEIVDGGHTCLVAALPLADLDAIAFLSRARDLNPLIGMVVVAGNPQEIEDRIEGLEVFSVSPVDVKPEVLVEKVQNACELAQMSDESRTRLGNAMDGEVTKMRSLRHEIGCDTRIYSPEELREIFANKMPGLA